ncbi:General transcription factor IIH subunit 1 [Cichlidogyrus casuarinus]|uniref:General transcription factor IIH subunit 1 n=1 Tax=Cichlidogyrus casuarinus TaxID=1844966 RepID=A0ABD2QC58_9PLAT
MSHKEDVLLMVKHVLHKKTDGTLYVNSGRVAWKNQSSDSFKISANFEDIRIQRKSPAEKDKVQLQLLMNNGDSYTFHFSHPDGREKQLELRNKVIEMLQTLLPTFKDRAHGELKEKCKILEKNATLLQLYKELVVPGILPSDEFWSRPEFHQLDKKDSSKELNTAVSASLKSNEQKLPLGVPSTLLSDIKPQVDGSSGIRYNLTLDMIDAIFRAYPTVKQKHVELVPSKMTEQDFWIKFFQSHYFHKDRVKFGKDEIFASCALQDDRNLLNDLRKSRRLRVTGNLDLTSLTDHQVGKGYGIEEAINEDLIEDLRQKKETDTSTGPSTALIPSSKLSANQMLLRRFNNHSALILKSLGNVELPNMTYDQANGVQLRRRLYENELKKPEETAKVELNLKRVEDYLEGPSSTSIHPGDSAVTKMAAAKRTYNETAAKNSLQSCKQLLLSQSSKQRRLANSLLQPLEAQRALSDASPGGCLVQGKGVRGGLIATVAAGQGAQLDGVSGISTSALLNQDQVKELRSLYSSTAELLRHFWACFPVTNATLSEKLDRINQSINQFKKTKLVPFEAVICGVNPESNLSQGRPASGLKSRVTAHLNEMINSALNKYSHFKKHQITS